MEQVTLNMDKELYVIPCGAGYACLGFDVLEGRYRRIASELVKVTGFDCPAPKFRGTLERYAQYQALMTTAKGYHDQTGYRFHGELTPELIPFEGKRVEVVHRLPGGTEDKTRFIVGKSTGWLPAHIKLMCRDSHGGPAVCLGTILSVRAV